jgi:succinate dehydrogenase / fumarate reductase cytochrome b subunit
MPRRPLSPHLFIYRFAYTMALSILHRLTGVALAVGLIVLVLWLLAISCGAETYRHFVAIAGGGFFRVLLAAWLVSFVYHFANGIRHLNWDAGRGLEKTQARRSARLVVVLVALAALLLIYAFFFRGVLP